jgi:hypothetical protein
MKRPQDWSKKYGSLTRVPDGEMDAIVESRGSPISRAQRQQQSENSTAKRSHELHQPGMGIRAKSTIHRECISLAMQQVIERGSIQ